MNISVISIFDFFEIVRFLSISLWISFFVVTVGEESNWFFNFGFLTLSHRYIKMKNDIWKHIYEHDKIRIWESLKIVRPIFWLEWSFFERNDNLNRISTFIMFLVKEYKIYMYSIKKLDLAVSGCMLSNTIALWNSIWLFPFNVRKKTTK